jgi:hypothetical protein
MKKLVAKSQEELGRVYVPKSQEELAYLQDSYFEVVCLFDQIKVRHGDEVARQMFADRANSWSFDRLSPRDQENLALLVKYYQMKKPRIKTLAKLLAEHGRSGPRGTTNRKALERQIKRLLKDDRKAYKRARTNLLYLYVDVYGSDLRFPQELLGELEDWEPKPWETPSPE